MRCCMNVRALTCKYAENERSGPLDIWKRRTWLRQSALRYPSAKIPLAPKRASSILGMLLVVVDFDSSDEVIFSSLAGHCSIASLRRLGECQP